MVRYDTICLGDSIYLGGGWQYDPGTYLDTFENAQLCDSIVHTHLSTTTECYWPTAIVYVDSSASGENTGHNWANAYIDLQYALDVAARYLNVEQIWIAKGTYYPTAGVDRTATFHLSDSVGLYGGFIGSETSVSERDPATNPVTLSGDIGIQGAVTDNSYHVLTCDDTTQAVVIDGCHIAGGNANGTAPIDQVGAGLLNHGVISVVNCTFADVYSTLGGHGIFNSGPSAELTLHQVSFSIGENLAVLSTNNALITVAGQVIVQ